jgi:type I restriction enzyme S subunit
VPLKHVAAMNGRIGWQNLRSEEFTDTGPYLVTGMHFGDAGRVDWNRCFHVTHERWLMAPDIQLRPDDVLVTKDGSIGKVAIVDDLPGPAALNSHLLVIRPLRGAFTARFLFYVLTSRLFADFIDLEKRGTTFDGLTQESMGRFPMPLPPLATQRAIADHLDRETARIDALIAHRQRMAELVRERWDALIRRATRLGLNADRLVRQSGVPWIGEVPDGWRVLPLRRVGRLMAGTAFPDDEQGRGDGPIPYFKVADFNHPENGEYLTAAENTVTPVVARALHSPLYPAGAVVFPKIGAALLSNRRRLLAKASCTDQNVMGLVVGRGHPRFYYYLLQSFDFGRLRMPGPVPLLNEADAASILVPVPPDEEQSAIVTHLDARAASVRHALGALEHQRSRLHERRAALITAAVTGELEKPEVAA